MSINLIKYIDYEFSRRIRQVNLNFPETHFDTPGPHILGTTMVRSTDPFTDHSVPSSNGTMVPQLGQIEKGENPKSWLHEGHSMTG